MVDSPETPDTPKTPVPPVDLSGEITLLVRRSLVELGDMQELQEKAKSVSERISKLTPPPQSPKTRPLTP
jgi:hypothetical protein